MTRQRSNDAPRPRLALVLWNGRIGGAEILWARIAICMRKFGAHPTLVFVESPEPLVARLRGTDVSYTSLGWARGRDVLSHPRRFATELSRVGPDGALLVERGFMSASLRAGGYRGPVIAVEHGWLLFEQYEATPRRLLRRVSRVGGALSTNAEVGVSDFMIERMGHHRHARRMRRIYNGIDPDTYWPAPTIQRGRELVAGFVGRLIPGKGADALIRALAAASKQIPARLLIAGDGSERPQLVSLAEELGVMSHIELLGVVDDLPSFWQRCNVAAIPSSSFLESFSMVTLEAMACGKAIVATRNGAIPELVLDGVTGTLVPPGDIDALARAMVNYAEHPDLQRAHGAAARARAIEQFHIEDCAQAYLDLFREVAG